MPNFILITAAALATGLLSLTGGVILLHLRRLGPHNLRYLVSFAAGAMLSAAFLDILPEAISAGDGAGNLVYVLYAMVFFFLTEKFLLWHHHSHEHAGGEPHPVGFLVIVGDSLHNFLDGITITVTFLVSLPLGLVTTAAIIFHEIPQEIGDFAILLDAGFARLRVLWWNLFSSLATLVGAWLALFFADSLSLINSQLLSLAAGSFIYIAAADLIPQIHRETDTRRMTYQALALCLGMGLIGLLVKFFAE
ncbi:MAG: ZIP family metal transporter [Candidatus Kerfeldbacteria bacterium]|nr:ZIP family metal transporter [Candidatus Kerfeldbacteria bacterium]